LTSGAKREEEDEEIGKNILLVGKVDCRENLSDESWGGG